jgi:toxin YoeB
MGQYIVKFSESVIKELDKHKKSGNKSLNKKIDKMFNELKNNPYTGEGQPEQLKHNLIGFWSRRINKEHRIIYSVDESIVTVYVIAAMGHYFDR